MIFSHLMYFKKTLIFIREKLIVLKMTLIPKKEPVMINTINLIESRRQQTSGCVCEDSFRETTCPKGGWRHLMDWGLHTKEKES